MIKYLLGLIKHLFNRRVSKIARVDNLSKIGSKSRILRYAHIFNSEVKDYTYVGVGSSVIYAEVGKFCSIGANSICGMGIHTLDNLSTSPIFTEKRNALGISWSSKESVYPFKKLIIGNDVWIGARVMIMGGLTIGDGAVVGAGAVVTKNVPPYAIVAGVPAKVIRYRFDDETINNLLKMKWWDRNEKWLKSHVSLFQCSSNDIDLRELCDLTKTHDCY